MTARQRSRFTATYPLRFSDFLNEISRTRDRPRRNSPSGSSADARALFFPDGSCRARGLPLGLSRRLAALVEGTSALLIDFVGRARTPAREELQRSSPDQFGYEDFASFCALSGRSTGPCRT